MRQKALSRQQGFTLVELLVVIGIIALLTVSILLPLRFRRHGGPQHLRCSAMLSNLRATRAGDHHVRE